VLWLCPSAHIRASTPRSSSSAARDRIVNAAGRGSSSAACGLTRPATRAGTHGLSEQRVREARYWHDRGVTSEHVPLSPVYAFNGPAQPIQLYCGDIGGLAVKDLPGAVELRCVPEVSIEWTVDDPFESPQFSNRRDEIPLTLHRPGGYVELRGYARGIEGGWSNGATFGSKSAPLNRLIAHWFNLPNWHGPEYLEETTAAGEHRQWWGRWVMEAEGWITTLDVRHDHSAVWTDLHKSDVQVMTHVMEIRRADGAAFTAEEADPVLAALHVGFSFALGRWVAPMIPVGLDSNGAVAWEEWQPSFCDSGRAAGVGWWYERDHAALSDFLKLLITAFSDPDRRERLWMQMVLAISAISAPGYVEHRIMVGFSGIEHVMWQNLVLTGLCTEHGYRNRNYSAENKLRDVLTAASIPAGIDSSLQPVISNLAAAKKADGLNLDGAGAVAWTRNRLVHPKAGKLEAYQYPGLLVEVWLLLRHYLVLLILHSLGYQSSYRDLRMQQGMASTTVPVPWATSEIQAS
jgi:hypothetical protein